MFGQGGWAFIRSSTLYGAEISDYIHRRDYTVMVQTAINSKETLLKAVFNKTIQDN